MADGRLAVVDAGSGQVRVFGPDGSFLYHLGRQGGGPEEFGMPLLAGALSDTLVVVDRVHHRLSFVHPDRGFLRVRRVVARRSAGFNASSCTSRPASRP